MTKSEFIVFLGEFRELLQSKSFNFENNKLPDFLEAMKRYTEDIQGYYDNQGGNIDSNIPTWENFKTILLGAAVYE
ncbi:hypothetical protein N9B82_02515 [Saprospiraceae bacterium]|nr:hypothetical protein [Saprospiraceae bacterium]